MSNPDKRKSSEEHLEQCVVKKPRDNASEVEKLSREYYVRECKLHDFVSQGLSIISKLEERYGKLFCYMCSEEITELQDGEPAHIGYCEQYDWGCCSEKCNEQYRKIVEDACLFNEEISTPEDN